jgi:hypothetical protein
MNTGRIIGAGLLAGLVLNIGEYVLNGIILASQWKAAMADLGLEDMSGGDIGVLVFFTFLTGIALVWLYAAMRPRFGPGFRTAVIAGFFVWLFVGIWPFIWNNLVPLWPSNLTMVALVWTFFEYPIAAAAGAWMYKERPLAAVTTA